MANKNIIWSNHDINLEDWIQDLKEDYKSEVESNDVDKLYNIIYEINNSYLDDERAAFREIDNLTTDIIAIGKIGRWNGTFSGYKEINSLENCLYSECDYVTWYVDQYGNFRCSESHHDGNNEILYRAWKPDISDEQKDNFIEKILSDKVTSKDISKYTYRLGDIIGKYYGWKFRGAKS